MQQPTLMDRNEAFADEKHTQMDTADAAAEKLKQQLATGDVKHLGGNRYRYMTGWDAGEVFTANYVDGRLSVLNEHGLDETTGTAALYSTVTPWHGLGTVVPGGVRDIDTVMELAKINYGVTKEPIKYLFNGTLREHANQYVTVRTDTGASLGTVGERYAVIQNRESFEFLQALTETYDVKWESAGALGNGERTFVSMRLPDVVSIDATGISDQIIPFLAVLNSHDGTSSLACVCSPWRPICKNTERFATRDAQARWTARHTKNAASKIAEARRTMGLTLKYYEAFAAEETKLAHNAMTMNEVDALIAQLWPIEDDATKATRTNHANRRNSIMDLWGIETGRVGHTAYATERAITGYLDHHKSRRSGDGIDLGYLRASAALVGDDDNLKTKAHHKLMLRVR